MVVKIRQGGQLDVLHSEDVKKGAGIREHVLENQQSSVAAHNEVILQFWNKTEVIPILCNAIEYLSLVVHVLHRRLLAKRVVRVWRVGEKVLQALLRYLSLVLPSP